ncbi:uncharacterized protein Dsimw501_GD14865, isoform A [Drosophila simulans]|uniref:Uncharacterized protein, isoform A n=1 Tax=Drosophila simulans TaxID=7240 RepID=A0A0J9RYR0_DROSI|nr:uncharacterized protein Dsimw501_GD14865, isoform A [Drosophila simulans]
MAMKRGNQLMRPSLFVLLSGSMAMAANLARVGESERLAATPAVAAAAPLAATEAAAEAKKDFRACGLRSVCNGIPRATDARTAKRRAPDDPYPYTTKRNRDANSRRGFAQLKYEERNQQQRNE